MDQSVNEKSLYTELNKSESIDTIKDSAETNSSCCTDLGSRNSNLDLTLEGNRNLSDSIYNKSVCKLQSSPHNSSKRENEPIRIISINKTRLKTKSTSNNKVILFYDAVQSNSELEKDIEEKLSGYIDSNKNDNSKYVKTLSETDSTEYGETLPPKNDILSSVLTEIGFDLSASNGIYCSLGDAESSSMANNLTIISDIPSNFSTGSNKSNEISDLNLKDVPRFPLCRDQDMTYLNEGDIDYELNLQSNVTIDTDGKVIPPNVFSSLPAKDIQSIDKIKEENSNLIANLENSMTSLQNTDDHSYLNSKLSVRNKRNLSIDNKKNLKKRKRKTKSNPKPHPKPVEVPDSGNMDLINPLKSFSFNRDSPFSFIIQSILEYNYKYECYPSSTNMARLAKILEIQWKDVRNWFISRRLINKKRGIMPRYAEFSSCIYCPQFSVSKENPSPAIAHLVSRSHLSNIRNFLEKSSEITHAKAREENAILEYAMPANASIEYNTTFKKFRPSYIISGSKPDTKLGNRMEQLENLRESLSLNKKKYKAAKTKIDSGVFESSISRQIGDGSSLQNHKERSLNEFHTSLQKAYSKLNGFSTNQPKHFENNEHDPFVGFQCPHCNLVYCTEWLLLKHSLVHRKFICSECFTKFDSELELQNHLKSHLLAALSTKLLADFACLECMKMICVCKESTQSVSFKSFNNTSQDVILNTRKDKILKPKEINDHLRVRQSDVINNVLASHQTEISVNRSNLNEGNLTYTNHHTFTCHLCESFFFNHEDLSNHMDCHDKKTEEETESIPTVLGSDEEVSTKEGLFCCFCHAFFCKEIVLRHHLRYKCSASPKSLTDELYSNSVFYLEKIKNTKYCYAATEKVVKCKVCSLFINLTNFKTHATVCKHRSSIKRKRDNEASIIIKKPTVKNSLQLGRAKKLPTENLNSLFVCDLCSLPLESLEKLSSHWKSSCTRVKNKKTNWKPRCIQLKNNDIAKYFNMDFMAKFLDFPKTVNNCNIICKFCQKKTQKRFLLTHLISVCNCVPLKFCVYLSNNKEALAKILENQKKNVSDTDHNNKETYDCHLCEKKLFRLPCFTKHMWSKHTLRISMKAAEKWCSKYICDSKSTLKIPQESVCYEVGFGEHTNCESIQNTIVPNNKNPQSKLDIPKQSLTIEVSDGSSVLCPPIMEKNKDTSKFETNIPKDDQLMENFNSDKNLFVDQVFTNEELNKVCESQNFNVSNKTHEVTEDEIFPTEIEECEDFECPEQVECFEDDLENIIEDIQLSDQLQSL